MTHEEPKRSDRVGVGVEVWERGSRKERVVVVRCGGYASDRTDGVHKARRAKLDREHKEREGEGEEVNEGENEHAVVGWGNKGTSREREGGGEGG